MLQVQRARTGATLGVRRMKREHRCSSTEGEHATKQERLPLDNDKTP